MKRLYEFVDILTNATTVNIGYYYSNGRLIRLRP